ncbi:MAG: hypothetical protein AAF558_08600 [Verrucomicrobiota bacterium]
MRVFLCLLFFCLDCSIQLRAASIAVDTLYDFESFTPGVTTFTTSDAPFSQIEAALTTTAQTVNSSTALQIDAVSAGQVAMNFSTAGRPSGGTFSFQYATLGGQNQSMRIVSSSDAGELYRLILNTDGSLTYQFGDGIGGTTTTATGAGIFQLDGSFNNISVVIDTASDTWGFTVGSTTISGLNFKADVDASLVYGNTFRAQGSGGISVALDDIQFSTIPEPSSISFFALGAGGIILLYRRKCAF